MPVFKFDSLDRVGRRRRRRSTDDTEWNPPESTSGTLPAPPLRGTLVSYAAVSEDEGVHTLEEAPTEVRMLPEGGGVS